MWIAFHWDFGDVVVFGPDEEVECLRYAIENSMAARQVKLGASVREQVNG